MRGEGGSASAIFIASPLTLALSPEGRGDTAAGGCGSGYLPPAGMTGEGLAVGALLPPAGEGGCEADGRGEHLALTSGFGW